MNEPTKPLESDCCNSGCNPCIFDVYEEQLRKYEQGAATDKTKFENCLHQIYYTRFKLVSCIKHTHDTNIYRFKYDADDTKVGKELQVCYEPGQHFLLRGENAKGYFTRAYTPVMIEHQEDSLEFSVLIKLYKQGAMSELVSRMKIGDETFWRGPYGEFRIKYDRKYLLCIAQGTGLAPIYSVIDNILRNDECETFVMLFFCCRTNDDVLLRTKLRDFSRYWNFKYELFFSQQLEIADDLPYGEVYHMHRLSQESICSYLKDKGIGRSQVLVCGSEMFNKEIHEALRELNVCDDQLHLF